MLLKDKLKDYRLILASHSPRRRELLAGCGLDFVLADGYEVEEVYPAGMPAGEVAVFLAQLKSESYPQELNEGDILITADTIVICGGEILGKPDGRQGAMEMLRRISGRSHRVVTGVALRTAGRTETFSAYSDVWMRDISDEEIEFYVDNYEPFDKAGAYGVQEWIGYAAVKRIEGSFYNVMGLPIQTLYVKLDGLVDALNLQTDR